MKEKLHDALVKLDEDDGIREGHWGGRLKDTGRRTSEGHGGRRRSRRRRKSRRSRRRRRSVSWSLKPSQPQRILSGLRETFLKNNVVERTYKAEIRPQEQGEKAESCRETL